jgi:hypothetical protein
MQFKTERQIFNTALISTHTSTEEEDESENNSFYDKEDNIYQKASKYYLKMFIGYMNAKV